MNPEDYDVTQIPIEQVRPGISLVIQHDGHAMLFQVESRSFRGNPQTTIYTLNSEPLEDGQSMSIDVPAGTMMHQVTYKK